MKTRTILAAALVCALAPTNVHAQTINTRLGKIEVESGYPSKDGIGKLTDEMDYQRACQAYIWGLPIVGLHEWQKTHDKVFKVRNGQLVSYLSFEEKLGIMTPNFDTPYIAALADLEKNGPLVLELPKGLMAGMMMDAWQRSITDLGVVGPDKGEGGKYLILGPGQKDPKAEGFFVFRSPTRTVLFGVRLLDPDRDRALRELVPQIRSYAWSERENPPKEQVVPANPPAKQFWSVTVYDEKNRQMLINETKRIDVSSRNPAVVKNADGSVDIYVGPTAPKGFENNWVQTKPGEG